MFSPPHDPSHGGLSKPCVWNFYHTVDKYVTHPHLHLPPPQLPAPLFFVWLFFVLGQQWLGTKFLGTFVTLKLQCTGRSVFAGLVRSQRIFVGIKLPTIHALEVFLAGVDWQVVVQLFVRLEHTAANGALDVILPYLQDSWQLPFPPLQLLLRLLAFFHALLEFL